MTRQPLRHDEVLAVVGDIGDLKIARIIETGATREELERAAAWQSGESDVLGEARDLLVGIEADVFDILTSDDEDDDAGRDRGAAGV